MDDGTIKLVCSTTEDYLEKTKPYLQTVNNLSKAENVIMTVDFIPDVTFFAELPHISWAKISHDENEGAPEGTHSIQHGSFIDKVSDNDNDVLIYTDCDIVMQRPFSDVELLYFSTLPHNSVAVGWNSGPHEKLIHEALRLNMKMGVEELQSLWGDNVLTEPCFNIGVLAARKSTWRLMYNKYMEKWSAVGNTFGHRARQQWLMCWVMAELGLDRKIMPYWMHTHAHYGLPRGTVVYGNGIAGHQDRIILFRHRF